MEIGSEEIIQKQILQQAEIAIETADVILYVTDVKTGVTTMIDRWQTNYAAQKNLWYWLSTKWTTSKATHWIFNEFYELAIGDTECPFPQVRRWGLGICWMRSWRTFLKMTTHRRRRCNQSCYHRQTQRRKSSLINKILGEDRLIVSNIPGTPVTPSTISN